VTAALSTAVTVCGVETKQKCKLFVRFRLLGEVGFMDSVLWLNV